MTDLSAPPAAPGEWADQATPWGIAAASTRSVAIIIIDHDGMIMAWNDGAQDMFGYHARDVIGRPILNFAEASSQSQAMETLLDPFADDGYSRWYRHCTGRLVFCMARMSLLGTRGDGSAQQALFLCDATDIRERFEALGRRLIEQEERCDEALNADACKDRCLALISHELKQPLTTILLVTERLLGLPADTQVQRITEDLQDFRSATRRMARIVDDLLDISRVRAGKIRLEPMLVHVDELVRHVSATIAATAPDSRIVVDVEASDCRCMGDPVRLEQIISNLLHNAIKFSGSGGRINVRVECDDGFAKIEVADDGIGISREFLPHVFSMFGQEPGARSSSREGLGIGLALVNDLVKAHAGRISARSDGIGKGARFTVWFPLAIKSMPAQPMPSRVASFDRVL
ncbi:sensor histidine kinase [Dyella soli]|uniref:sensor histidine kinase n=1 Tax=Dyella soli TaxID=522319 RepID=UPI0013F44499|nr:PAS domain-containing sensor histidine kinase [Dyella soli]